VTALLTLPAAHDPRCAPGCPWAWIGNARWCPAVRDADSPEGPAGEEGQS
jgi:hypothetical protein